MVETQSAVGHRMCKDHSQRMGMSRFLNNDRLTLSALTTGITQSWYTASLEHKDLFVIQDTSDINAHRHQGRIAESDTDLGPLWGKNALCEYGFFLHPCLVLEANSGFPLGFSDILTWNRNSGEAGRHERNYKRQAIEQKTSYRWLRGIEKTQALLGGAHQATRYHIMDREADIYELFTRYQDSAQDQLIIRMNRDRLVYVQGQASPVRLHRYLAGKSNGIILDIALPRAGQRKAHTARMELFYERVEIKRPKDRTKAQGPARLPIWIVHIRELPHNVPQGQKPVQWTIWASWPIENKEQALWVIEAYKKRWCVEEFFSLLKTKGLELESAQLESGIALKRLTLLACKAALTILQLIKDRDNQHQQSVRLVLDEQQIPFVEMINKSVEGQTKKQQNPYPVNSLARLAWVVARLGGFSGYQSQSPAGPNTMTLGWKRFNDMLFALKFVQQLDST